MKKKIKLSASKIKTLDSCTWLYHCQYTLKIPQTTNLGASRGLCAHTVLETFIKKRHFKHYNSALKSIITKAVDRLVRKHAKKLKVTEEVDIGMIFEMITTACQYDFFCKEGGGDQSTLVAEKEFKIESNNYIINGFLDKIAFYPDEKIKITDYKTSKAKFAKDEIENNLQGLMYSLACYKEYKTIPDVEFLFLRFPKNPSQFFARCTKSQLKGFECYLDYLAEFLKDFDENKAKSKMAYHDIKKKWLCGREGLKKDGGQAFICQYRRPCVYYVERDKAGEIIRSSFKKSELNESNKIEKMEYNGCPAFKNFQIKNNTEEDPFNIFD